MRSCFRVIQVISLVSLLQVDLDEPVTAVPFLLFLFPFCFVLYFIVIPVSVTLLLQEEFPTHYHMSPSCTLRI